MKKQKKIKAIKSNLHYAVDGYALSQKLKKLNNIPEKYKWLIADAKVRQLYLLPEQIKELTELWKNRKK